LAVLLRILGFQGYSSHDPDSYAMLARDLANGIIHVPGYDGLPQYPFRIGVYGPPAIFIRVFGVSELTMVAYPFLVSVGGCILAYILARRMYSPIAGLIALGILAVLPADVKMASLLYPDALKAFWANAGVLFAMVALPADRMRQAAYAFLAGMCFGIAWLTTEPVVHLAPFVII
jgi:4-amino-4-deoxy-L-arabinose transferase-like glycosyltransferase